MTPDCIRLANICPENRRLIHNALEPLGWRIENSSIEGAGTLTPEGAVEILIVEAPPAPGRPVVTHLPTLWLLPPATVIPRVAGEGPHDFIRLPAPCEVIVARCMGLVRTAMRERTLRRYEREAVLQIDRRQGAVAKIAHQLGSPLSALIEYLELLSESPKEEMGARQREIVREARQAARRVAEKVEEIVDATATEAGIAIDVSLSRTESRPILEGIQEWALPRLRALGQQLSLQLEPDLPPLCGDAERISQALRYLLEHASSAASSGGQVEIAAGRDPDMAGFARISVAERRAAPPGAGPDPSTQPDPADRRGPVEASPEEAGLRLVDAIVRALGGRMRRADPAGGTSGTGGSGGTGRIDLSIPLWGTRAGRIAEAQGILRVPGKLHPAAWVCRATGSAAAALPESVRWIELSPGEFLAVCADAPEGIATIGRVRDLREPGSLADALQPRLEIRSAHGTAEPIPQEEELS